MRVHALHPGALTRAAPSPRMAAVDRTRRVSPRLTDSPPRRFIFRLNRRSLVAGLTLDGDGRMTTAIADGSSSSFGCRSAPPHGLGAMGWKAHGEAILAAERRTAMEGGGAHRHPSAPREPSPDAAAGLLLGRLNSNAYSVAASEDEGGDPLAGLPPGVDPTCVEGEGGVGTYVVGERDRCLLFGGVSRDAMDHDEEIYFSGDQVIWSAGGVVRVRFTAPEPVRQVLWTAFPERVGADPASLRGRSRPEPTLCLRHAAALTTYAPSRSGAALTVPLPRDVTGDAWTTALGLLLPTSRGLVLLGHPLDEPSPVLCVSDRSDERHAETKTRRGRTHPNAPGTEASPFESAPPGEQRVFSETVVWTSTTSSLVLTHHPTRRSHALWSLSVATGSVDAAADAVVPSDDRSMPFAAATETQTTKTFPPFASTETATADPLTIDLEGPTGRPRVAMTRVWVQPSGAATTAASSAAIAHDDDGTPVIALLDGGSFEVVGLRLDPGDVPLVAFRLSRVSSFVAVAATRAPMLDLLVLQRESTSDGRHSETPATSSPSGSIGGPCGLALFCGERRVAAWAPSAALTGDVSVGSLVRLCSPVGARSTGESSDGRAVRLTAPTAPGSPAVAALLDAVEAALGGSDRAEAMSTMVTAAAGAASSAAAWGPDAATRVDEEWEAVTRALNRWCGCDPDGRTADTAADVAADAATSRDGEEADDAAWTFLLERARRPPRGNGHVEPPGNVPRAFALLEAAHAAYECAKLDALRRRALAPLGRWCAFLASACVHARHVNAGWTDLAASAAGYLEHHLREHMGGAGGMDHDVGGDWAARTHHAGGAPVPDLMSALENVFAGSAAEEWADLVPPLVAEASRKIGGRQPRGGPTATADAGEGPLAEGSGAGHFQKMSVMEWAARVIAFATSAAAAAAAAAAGNHVAARAAAATTAAAMSTAGFGLAELARLPPGVSVPLRDALQWCRRDPPKDWPASAYALIGRDDMAAGAGAFDDRGDLRMRSVPGVYAADGGFREGNADGESGDPEDLHGAGGRDGWEGGGGGAESGDGGEREPDGTAHLEGFAGRLLLFGRDRRLREARGLLTSANPVAISLSGGGEGGGGGGGGDGDSEAVTAQQARLWALAPRTASLPVGRGALTLGTARARPTEALRVPALTLAGCLPAQRNATVKLDVSSGGAAGPEFTAWPEFHNGAAAGLALAARTKGEMTRAWIVFNRPREPSHGHAGVLMALGLTGHLRALTNTDLYRYLVQEHDATTLGVLIGTAAAWRGTMHPDASKMCFLHLPTRHPAAFPEVELSSPVQAAAMLSLGLLYQGTAHRLMAEILLGEIGREPGGDGAAAGREGYALSAGLALGLVTLGRGRNATGLADLCIPERLRRYFGGGGEAVGGGMSSRGGGGRGGGGVEGWSPEDGGYEGGRLDTYRSGSGGLGGGEDLSGGGAGGGGRSGETGNGQVMEGAVVNLDVTAPGATLALGLMFLRTGDVAVASHVRVPNTHYALDHARPDFVLLMVVAHSLIMWDDIEPTVAWVEGNLPPILRIPLADAAARDEALEGLGDEVGGPGGPPGGAVDRETLVQAHVHALAGGCMALGLRFAGTADRTAAETLREMTLRFLRLKSAAAPGRAMGKLIDRPTLEMCVGVAAVALSCVMAGTGDLATMRLLRMLRLRLDVLGNGAAAAAAAAATSGRGCGAGLTHGAHMAVGMAMGFLFLGGGTKTFATDNASIAALLISIYPRFPQHTADQRCHLQAFRHLYVLAARGRLLETVDATTRRPVYAPVELTVRPVLRRRRSSSRPSAADDKNRSKENLAGRRDGEETHAMDAAMDDGEEDYDDEEGHLEVHRVTAPCLLPEESRLVRLRVVGDRYWPTCVELSSSSGDKEGEGGARSFEAARETLYRRRQLSVQRLTGALPYAADPTGARAGLARALHTAAAAVALRPPRLDGGAGGSIRLDGAAGGPNGLGHETQDAVGVFTSDPSLLGFKRLMCGGAGEGEGGRGGHVAAYCRAALHECMAREEPAALPAYVDLHASVAALLAAAAGGEATVRIPDDAAAIRHALTVSDVRLLAVYASRYQAAAAEAKAIAASGVDNPGEGEAAVAPSRVLPPSLVAGFHAAIARALEDRGYGEPGGQLARYLAGGARLTGGEADGLFGCYLRFFQIPAPSEVRGALTAEGMGAPGSGLDPDVVAPVLLARLPGVPPAAILRVAKCGI